MIPFTLPSHKSLGVLLIDICDSKSNNNDTKYLICEEKGFITSRTEFVNDLALEV